MGKIPGRIWIGTPQSETGQEEAPYQPGRTAKHHRGNETTLEVAESISEVEGEVNGSGLSQCDPEPVPEQNLSAADAASALRPPSMSWFDQKHEVWYRAGVLTDAWSALRWVASLRRRGRPACVVVEKPGSDSSDGLQAGRTSGERF